MTSEIELTDEQKRLLSHDPGLHARLEAGPGTGKSFTLVAYLNSLLKREDPPRVRLLTFTRAATAELAEKLSEAPATQALRPSTVHSFAISILLQNPGTGRFPEPLRIADSWEDDRIVLDTLKIFSGFDKRKLKRDLLPKMQANWESLDEDAEFHVMGSEKARFLGAWEEHRSIMGYTLRGELPYRLLKALEDHDDLKGVNFDLLLVDEYQDLNACDLAVLKHLAERGSTLIAAGDSDQSIYGWRHADPSGIGRFTREYPDAEDYPLSVTMRCGSRIIEWANHVIAGDPGRRHDRHLLTPICGSPPGEVGIFRYADESAEAEDIGDMVATLIDKKGVSAKEILILLRGDHNRVFSTPIRKVLESRGIKCSDPGFVKEVLSRDCNRRFLAALRLIINPKDSLAWATLLVLTDGVGPSFIRYVYEFAQSNNLIFAEALLKLEGSKFKDGPSSSEVASTELFRIRYSLSEIALPPMLSGTSWLEWIEANVEDYHCDEDLKTLLMDVERQLDDPELPQLLSQIEPLGNDIAQARSDGVRIMTMAMSKGLTVRATILPAVEDEIIPNPRSNDREERRLLYVAMTRSKEYLYCTWCRRRTGATARSGSESFRHRTISRFLRDGPVSTRTWQSHGR